MYKDTELLDEFRQAYREALAKSDIQVGHRGFLDTDRQKGFAQGLVYAAWRVFRVDIAREYALECMANVNREKNTE